MSRTREWADRRAVPARTACFVALVAALAAAFVAPASTAGAAGTHRAGVIVDTNTGTDHVHKVVITFSEDSITGAQALERAGASPVVKGSALGVAICKLYGVGHEVDSCLGSGSDARYWAYWHVPQVQSGFTQATFSGSGAGSVQVHDGDIEGWSYGNGLSQPPPFATIDQIDPPPPPPTTPATAPGAPADSGTPAGGSAGLAGGTTGELGLPSVGSSSTTIAPTAAQAAAAAAAAATSGAAGSSTTLPGGKDANTEVAAERASATHGTGGGGSAWSFVGFAAVMVLLAGGIFFARRARSGSRASAP